MILEIPEHLFKSITLLPDEKGLRIRKELAVRLYQKGLLSFGKARKLAQLNKWEFHNILGEEEIPRRYDLDDLDVDIKTLEKVI